MKDESLEPRSQWLCTKAWVIPTPGPAFVGARLQLPVSPHTSPSGSESSASSMCPGSPWRLRQTWGNARLCISFQVSHPQLSHGKTGIIGVCAFQERGARAHSAVSCSADRMLISIVEGWLSPVSLLWIAEGGIVDALVRSQATTFCLH